MITVRNPEDAHARTVFAGEDLEVGMVVKLVQGTNRGDPCSVVKPDAADLKDPNILLGIVDYHVDDDLAVDFQRNVQTQALTRNEDGDNTYEIPKDSPCVIWYNCPVIGFHRSTVDASLAALFDTVREGTLVDFAASAKLAVFDADPEEGNVAKGVLYEHEGAELTVIFHKL